MSSLRPGSVEELVGIVRDAAGAAFDGRGNPPAPTASTGFRIRGAGTWLDAGRADPRATVLDLTTFSGIHEYTPADLTISVGAATSLAELDAATRAYNQWCPLLPWGSDRSTVGATIATATSGPFADALGRPRDLVLGVECVDGRGRLIRAGGRVVKNVAGFDITRLMTGAWGTLGVITAVHLRLRARPVVDETWALSTDDAAAVNAFVRGSLAPLACTALDANTRWLVRIGGNLQFTAASRAALQRLGPCDPLPETAWTTLRATHTPADRTAQWRWDALSRRIKATFDPADLLNPGLLGVAR